MLCCINVYLFVGQPEPGRVTSKKALLVDDLVCAALVILDFGDVEAVAARAHCGVLLIDGVQRLAVTHHVVLYRQLVNAVRHTSYCCEGKKRCNC